MSSISSISFRSLTDFDTIIVRAMMGYVGDLPDLLTQHSQQADPARNYRDDLTRSRGRASA
jgi:hypothetical protein